MTGLPEDSCDAAAEDDEGGREEGEVGDMTGRSERRLCKLLLRVSKNCEFRVSLPLLAALYVP